jgi:hypothetical protein
VLLRATPWRLDTGTRELTTAWFTGWLTAACEQDPALLTQTRDYAQQRLGDAEAGRLRVLVHHRDVLAWPAAPAAPAHGVR